MSNVTTNNVAETYMTIRNTGAALTELMKQVKTGEPVIVITDGNVWMEMSYIEIDGKMNYQAEMVLVSRGTKATVVESSQSKMVPAILEGWKECMFGAVAVLDMAEFYTTKLARIAGQGDLPADESHDEEAAEEQPVVVVEETFVDFEDVLDSGDEPIDVPEVAEEDAPKAKTKKSKTKKVSKAKEIREISLALQCRSGQRRVTGRWSKTTKTHLVDTATGKTLCGCNVLTERDGWWHDARGVDEANCTRCNSAYDKLVARGHNITVDGDAFPYMADAPENETVNTLKAEREERQAKAAAKKAKAAKKADTSKAA